LDERTTYQLAGSVVDYQEAATGFAGGYASASHKRQLDAIKATPVSARSPWSPPVT
jgi:hypothetical protein